MNISIWGVVLATIAQFAVGMVWYTVVFGAAWGRIHGFDKLSKDEQRQMASKMGPFYGLQLIATVFTVIVLAKVIVLLPGYSVYALAVMLWFGLVLPTQYSAVVFGGTEPKWIVQKLAIMTGGTLVCLLVGAAILGAFN